MNALAPSITRWKKPALGGSGAGGSGSALTSATGGLGACCFTPVHSRKLPQVPQNASASALW